MTQPYTLAQMMPTPPRPRRRWPWIAVGAGVVLVVALVVAAFALGRGTTPAAAPAPTAAAAAATSAADDGRAGCRVVGELGTDFDPQLNADAGEMAARSANPGIASAGRALAEAARGSDGDPAGNLAVSDAQLELAEACAAAFGDAPW